MQSLIRYVETRYPVLWCEGRCDRPAGHEYCYAERIGSAVRNQGWSLIYKCVYCGKTRRWGVLEPGLR